MNRWLPESLSYYDCEIVRLISEKYGYEQMDALRLLVGSQTHAMLEDRECGLMSYGPSGVFDIWEAERITGDPRNSAYIRDE